jgi:hypothetical protein
VERIEWSAVVIDELSIALKSLLSPAMGGPEIDIVFNQPTEAFKPTRDTLNLFLYDIRENLELRTSEQRIEPRATEKVAIRRPLLRIACSYLITAWVTSVVSSLDEPPLKEQRLLSRALLLLKQYPTIPAAFLPASLKDQQPPLPLMVAQADGLKQPHEFWTAIGNKLRPSVTATITIGLEVPEPSLEGVSLVRGHDISLGERTSAAERALKAATQSQGYRIAGRVTDADKKPVQGATVSVAGTGLKTKTDAEGRYTLGLLAPGTYTLSLEAETKEAETKVETIKVALPDWKAAAIEGSAERFDVPLEIQIMSLRT